MSSTKLVLSSSVCYNVISPFLRSMMLPFSLTALPSVSSVNKRILTLDSASIAELLNTALFASGLTQAEVARRLGITPQSIDQYRRSVKTNPSVKWLVRYLQVCGGKLTAELPYEPL